MPTRKHLQFLEFC